MHSACLIERCLHLERKWTYPEFNGTSDELYTYTLLPFTVGWKEARKEHHTNKHVFHDSWVKIGFNAVFFFLSVNINWIQT